MAVYYRFHAEKTWRTLELSVPAIQGWDLRQKLWTRHGLGARTGDELDLVDATTGEPIKGGDSVPRGASLLLVRRPTLLPAQTVATVQTVKFS